MGSFSDSIGMDQVGGNSTIPVILITRNINVPSWIIRSHEIVMELNNTVLSEKNLN
jgi:hypothetical protein